MKRKPKNHKSKSQWRKEVKALRDQMDECAGKPLQAMSLMELKTEASFLQRVIMFETDKGPTIAQKLIESGVSLPKSESLSDKELSNKLWEVISGLANLGHYLNRTDHLCDRELYEFLWADLLNEKTCSIGADYGSIAQLHEILDPISIDYFKYYADELDQINFSDLYPSEEFPPREELPYDRDRILPKPGGPPF